MSAEVEQLVERRWAEYGIPGAPASRFEGAQARVASRLRKLFDAAKELAR